MRGSPLVYADLQRAGAKAAAAVIVLGKRSKSGLLQSTGAASDIDIESSIVDAEAIFTTMLIELKMDFTKIFTITELTDESNSKYLGTSFQLTQFFPKRIHSAVMRCNAILPDSDDDNDEDDGAHDGALQWWEYLLLHDAPQHKSGKAIFGMPLYMSGRVLHPELCENMLVQVSWSGVLEGDAELLTTLFNFFRLVPCWSDVLQPFDPQDSAPTSGRSQLHWRHPLVPSPQEPPRTFSSIR
ncbi:hypothetical protein PINS_up014249 [Pythium insidiosum]|nr:hypothetical protein PINS_up014249 [Pythium insidiosum]